MDEKQAVIELWKKKVEGIKSDPPIDYKTTFYETVKSLANSRYSILDIGTGTGRVIFENNLEKYYRKVVGIDIRPEMIEICREHGKGMKNVEFHVMDATREMKFRTGTFDVITALFPPYNSNEINRLLSPGGYFIVMSSLKGDHKELVKYFPDIAKYGSGYPSTTLKEITTSLKTSGFKIVSCNVLKYKWIFRDQEVMKRFYEKITFRSIFDGGEGKLNLLNRNIDGSITVTRLVATVVAKRV